MNSYSAILPLLSSILSLSLGIFVISRAPGKLANRAFAFSMSTLVLKGVGGVLLLLRTSLHIEQLGIWLLTCGDALIPGSWLLFSLAFSRTDAERVVKDWSPIIIISLLFPIGLYFYSLHGELMYPYIVINETSFLALGKTGRLFYLLFLIGLILVLANLETTLRASSMEKRWRIKFMILGFGGISAYSIYLSSQMLLYSSLQFSSIPVFSLIVILGESLMILSLLRNRLLDVDIFVSRSAIFSTLTLIFVGIYLVAIGIIIKGAEYLGIGFMASALTLIVFVSLLGLVSILLSEKLRRQTMSFIYRNFYKHKYDFRQKWIEVTNGLGSEVNLERLQESMLEFLLKTLGVREGSIWLFSKNRGSYIMTSYKELEENRLRILPGNSLIRFFHTTKKVFLVNGDHDEEGRKIYRENISLFSRTKAAVCVPLLSRGELAGFFTLGEKIIREDYVWDDMALLTALSNHVANQIMVIRLSEELLVAREVEAFNNVTSFFTHELKNVNTMLSLATQNAEEYITDTEFQKDLILTIRTATTKIGRLVDRVSHARRGLELFCRETEMKRFLRNIIHEFRKTINKNKGKDLFIREKLLKTPKVKVDREKIKEVVKNLLLNAYQALNGKGEINIKLFSNSDYVVIVVSDNGPGIPEEFIRTSLFKPFRTTKEEGFGIGLYQCKKILEAHKGRIEVDSEINRGSTFYIKLPLERKMQTIEQNIHKKIV